MNQPQGYTQQTHPVVPEPPRSGGGRGLWAVIGCVGCGVLVLILGIALVGIYGLPGGGGGRPEDGPTTSTAPVDPGSGTISDPYAFGTTVELELSDGSGTLEVTLSEVDWDAGDILEESDEDYEQPGEGNVKILVTSEYTFRGEGSVDPWYDVSQVFYATDGDEYYSGVDEGPNSWYGSPELSDGESSTIDVAFEVPESVVEGGSFYIAEPFVAEGGRWVHAQ